MSLPTFLSRQQIDDTAWDRCVAEAHNALFYGHSWYLDAVTSVPDGPHWRWEGLVLRADNGPSYAAVLPIPLRRRWGRWVIYQPLFCQFVALFSQQPIDPAPFLKALVRRYRYASRLCLFLPSLPPAAPAIIGQAVGYTHVLPVTAAPASYTADRLTNLRRAQRRITQLADWRVQSSTDLRPLLALFRTHHAGQIGVGDWAYGLFERVFVALQQRGLSTLRYAFVGDEPVAGVLFAEQHGRIVYLFNAASEAGRWLNTRTLLLHDRLQNAAARPESAGLLVDFESPDQPGIVQFYESFGATPVPYLQLSWNRLTRPERWLQRLKSWWKRA